MGSGNLKKGLLLRSECAKKEPLIPRAVLFLSNEKAL
jgi:hypothetical protein